MGIEYPIKVTGIDFSKDVTLRQRLVFGGECGDFVSVRPVADEYEGKTFLGILIGEVAFGAGARWDADSERLELYPTGHNPAILVPDLKRVIYGRESWWGRIKCEDDLRAITDSDIENVWYVKALKALSDDMEGE